MTHSRVKICRALSYATLTSRFANFMMLPVGAKVCTYFVETPIPPSYDFPIRQTPFDTILNGFMEHSVDADFCAEWVDSTDGWKNDDGTC
jgi:hypothetical protein